MALSFTSGEGEKLATKLAGHSLQAAAQTGSPLLQRTSAKLLPSIAALLSEQGHFVKVLTIPGHRLRISLLRSMRASHNRKEKSEARRSGRQPVPFDEGAASKDLKIVDDATYWYGWVFVPKTAIQQAESNSFHPVYSGDFAFMKGRTKGQLATITALDSDHHCIECLYMYVLDSENANTWKLALKYLFEAKVAIDDEQFRFISDADKGGEQAAAEMIENGQPFCDSVHRGKNVGQRVGGVAKAAYLACLKDYKAD